MTILLISLAVIPGAMLSLFFFGGLWWTVRRIDSDDHPARLLLTSFIVRTAVVLAGFYALGQWRWEAIAVAAAAFVITRFGVTRYLGPAAPVDPAEAGGPSWS